ncbi:hypothetical protein WUBG_12012 [Wuchereria bancrofti]|uniref:Uncharacterized protein n=1 Tax=Wuchereria bancrofti TaxID=6293 RepID=J9E4B1_WUCBA|nr:hypothetical protein WUBG_12012 [Wuchereria bancrofti]
MSTTYGHYYGNKQRQKSITDRWMDGWMGWMDWGQDGRAGGGEGLVLGRMKTAPTTEGRINHRFAVVDFYIVLLVLVEI